MSTSPINQTAFAFPSQQGAHQPSAALQDLAHDPMLSTMAHVQTETKGKAENQDDRFTIFLTKCFTHKIHRTLTDGQAILLESIPRSMIARGATQSANLCIQYINRSRKAPGSWIQRLHGELDTCSKKPVVLGAFDRDVRAILNCAIDSGDTESIRHLAHVLFSGRRLVRYFPHMACAQSFDALFDKIKDVRTSAGELSLLVLTHFQQWKQYLSGKAKEYGENSVYQARVWPENRYDYTGDCLEGTLKRPSKMIPVSHGGGYYHIFSFLFGHGKGYDIDGNGIGIYVSPKLERERHHYLERDVEYFPRCGGHFDRPVRLVAAMSEEFLLPSNLP
ncbi:MAG: hypothetical protein H0X51_03110, partial [Parachlamydiaceae bacterium]|nr:hypothetical protein [Parachlamydiaceae bacterium]